MNTIVVNADQGSQKISRHIYGHFMEHLSRCVYDGAWVGLDSAIPNTRGWRNDLIQMMRDIRVPNLRWPGGCFAEMYHWRDGIGPPADRPLTHVNETNAVGTHEFMDLCEIVGCVPYICGNLAGGSVREMQDWLAYMTSAGDDEMAALRRANGRDEPWEVPFWVIGNESMGCGGMMSPGQFAEIFSHYTKYVRPDYMVACGPNHDNFTWTEIMMDRAGDGFDGLAMHYYTIPGPWGDKGPAVDFGEDRWFITMQRALHIGELLKLHAGIMDHWDPGRQKGIIVDEWGTWYAREEGVALCYQQNTLRDALVAGVTFNIFHEYCGRVIMANIAQIINVLQAMILTEGERSVLTPTYHVFEMFKVHQDATMLPVEVTCEDYAYEGESVPAVSASASRDEAGVVHVSLCNLSLASDMSITCKLSGMSPSAVSGRILTHEDMTAHNTFDAPDVLAPTAFEGATLAGDELTVQLPAKSVVVLALT